MSPTADPVLGRQQKLGGLPGHACLCCQCVSQSPFPRAPSPEPPDAASSPAPVSLSYQMLRWFPSSPADMIVMSQHGICPLPLDFPIWQTSPCWLESFPLQSVSKLDVSIRELPGPEGVCPQVFSSQNGTSTSQHRVPKCFSPHIGKLFNFSQRSCQAARSKAWKTIGIEWKWEKPTLRFRNPGSRTEISLPLVLSTLV